MKGALASNWVVETFENAADGFKLLGSSKGYTSFSRAFKDGDKVFYAAHTDDGHREAGWAVVQGGKLVDRTPTATLTPQNVYTEGSPSPLAFQGQGTIACTFNAVAFDTIWDHVFREDNPHNVTAPQVDLEPVLAPLGPDEQNVQDALEFLFEHSHEGAGMVISATEPKDPETGMQWLDSTTAKVWIWDEDKWLEFPAAWSGGVVISASEPADPEAGMQWLDSTTAQVWIWDEDKWLEFPATGSGGDGSTVQIEDLPPDAQNVGDTWVDYGTTGEMYVWDGRFWVSMTGDGGPKFIIGEGEGGLPPDVELPENITFDQVESAEDFDHALARFIDSSNRGKWGRIKTSDILTNPEVTFRDANGRFKSTKDYEELTDQLKVNRFLAGEIESLSAEIDGIELPETDLSDYAKTEYVDSEIEAEKLERSLADIALRDSLQAEIDAIDIPDVDLDGYATEEWVTEQIDAIDAPNLDGYATEEWVTDQIDAIPEVDLADYATVEYVDKTEVEVLNAAIKVAQDGDKVLQEQIDQIDVPDLTGYATEQYVDDSIAAIDFPVGTIVSDTAPLDVEDGATWYDTVRLELFVYAMGAWLPCSPLGARVEQGEILQAQILSRVEAGEVQQQTLVDTKLGKAEANEVANSFRIKGTGGTYISASGGELGLYHVKYPEAETHAATMGYVDDEIAKVSVAGGGPTNKYDGNRFNVSGTSTKSLSSGEVMFLRDSATTTNLGIVNFIGLPEQDFDWDSCAKSGVVKVKNGAQIGAYYHVYDMTRNEGRNVLLHVALIQMGQGYEVDYDSGTPCYFHGVFFA